MTARIATLPPRAVIAIAAGVVLVYALVVWFLLVSPKRAEAASARRRRHRRRAPARRRASDVESAHATAGTHVTDVLRLAKAMPSSGDQPGLVLELDRLAARRA